MDTIAELRKKVQRPVRRYNDVAGLLVGDRVSIHVTRLFLLLGLSPTLATGSMLVCGVVGSALVVLGGGWAVVGLSLAFLYYIFDCVDGEVARYRGHEKLTFGFVDFVTHLIVKPAFYLCVGIWAVIRTGEPAMFLFAFAALLATLLQKLLDDAHVILVSRQILLRGREQRHKFVKELIESADDDLLEEDVVLRGDAEPYKPSGLLPLVRVAAVNFDLGLIAFLFAAIVDLFVEPFLIFGMRMDCKVLLVVFYGIVVPYDLIDRFISYVSGGEFTKRSRALLRRAHHFRCDEDVVDGD
jgi:hypothetical protein